MRSKKQKPELTATQQALLNKYKNQIGKRDELIDLNVRGEKPRKIAEYAECIKLIGSGDAFKIPISDFEKAFGAGKKGRNYVKSYLKRFGVPNPRVEPSADMMNLWMRGKSQEVQK